MKYKIFTYPVPPPEEPEHLNGFLSSTRVVSVQSHIVVKKEIPYLIFIVEYLDSNAVKNQAAPKIDYNVRAANRNRNPADNRNSNIGFRLCLSRARQ